MNKIFLIIWAVIMLAAWIIFGVITTKDQIYYGDEVKIQLDGRDIRIEAEAVNIEIEGTSTDYFQLKKGKEILYSIPENPPLGYKKDYFVLEKQSIDEGEWIVKQGAEIDIVLKSNENIMITTNYKDPIPFWLITFLLAVMIWGAGIAIMSCLD
jgi:hypothetical protein